MPGEQVLVKGAMEAAKLAAKKLAEQVAAHPDIARTVGAGLVTVGGKVVRKAPGNLKPRNVYRAERHAWTLEGGQFSTDISVRGRKRCVVWKDGVAVACYPPLTTGELNGTALGELAELTGVKVQLREDPRPPLRARHGWKKH